jgi:hypothetical protein
MGLLDNAQVVPYAQETSCSCAPPWDQRARPLVAPPLEPADLARSQCPSGAKDGVGAPGFPKPANEVSVKPRAAQIDGAGIIDTVHGRRAPMIPVSTSLRL